MIKCCTPTRQPLERYRLRNTHWHSVEQQLSSTTPQTDIEITTEIATEDVAMLNDEERQRDTLLQHMSSI